MSYNFLSASLQPTAEHAKKFFRTKFGVSTFRVEEQISPDIAYVPTLSAFGKDHYLICIEVSESAWPENNQLDSFVLDCKNRGLPIKLYVAMPKIPSDSNFKSKLQRAKSNGVGVIEVEAGGKGHIFHEALPLSLTGLRPLTPTDFPPKYRATVRQAEQTFCDGTPHKGCGCIYDEIENLSRKLAKKTCANGLWTKSGATKVPSVNLETGPWARVMEELIDNLDLRRCGCPKLDLPLLHRIAGITPHRNDSGHKPKNQSQLKKRDQELRTRFESARDLLRDLVDATKPLRL